MPRPYEWHWIVKVGKDGDPQVPVWKLDPHGHGVVQDLAAAVTPQLSFVVHGMRNRLAKHSLLARSRSGRWFKPNATGTDADAVPAIAVGWTGGREHARAATRRPRSLATLRTFKLARESADRVCFAFSRSPVGAMLVSRTYVSVALYRRDAVALLHRGDSRGRRRGPAGPDCAEAGALRTVTRPVSTSPIPSGYLVPPCTSAWLERITAW